MVAVAETQDAQVILDGEDIAEGRPDEEALGDALTRFQDVRAEIAAQVLGRETELLMLQVALLAGEHMLLIGPPGTAKSMLMDQLAHRIIQPQGETYRTWKILLGKFTPPEALLGPISVNGLKEDIYRHVTRGSFAETHLALMDEIYKASTAILNTLLLAINERQVDIGTGERIRIPLQTMICASNELPPDVDQLLAFHDRLLIRMQVGYLETDDFLAMLSAIAQERGHHLHRHRGAWQAATPGDLPPFAHITSADLELLQTAVGFIEVPPPMIGALGQVRVKLAEQGIQSSDRRWAQAIGALRAHALLNGRGTVDDQDLDILRHILWNKTDEIGKIRKEVARAANPAIAKVVEKLDQAESTFSTFLKAHKAETQNQAKYGLCADALDNLKGARTEITTVLEQAQGKKDAAVTARATAALERIGKMIVEVSEKLTN